MRYFAAFFLPPLGCLLSGRALATVANAFIYLLAWGLLFVLPLFGVLAWLLCVLHAFSCAEDFARKERRHEMNRMLVAQGHQPLPEERPFLSGLRGAGVAILAIIATIAAVFFYSLRNPEGVQSFGDGLRGKTQKMEVVADSLQQGKQAVRQHPALEPTPEVKAQLQSIEQTGEQIQRLIKARAALEGKTFAEVAATHGTPQAKDATTGWATWPKFKAQFQSGKVVTVEVP